MGNVSINVIPRLLMNLKGYRELSEHQSKASKQQTVFPFSNVYLIKKWCLVVLFFSIWPDKEEIYRTRLTAGGNLLENFTNVSTPTIDLTTIKVFVNSVISTLSTKYLVVDIKDCFI